MTAQDERALYGRPDGSPLTTVRAAPLAPTAPLVDTLAGAIDASPRGVVVAGRQRDPGLAEPLAALARRAGYPLLAEPTSQLRAGHHDRSQVIACYDALLRRPPSELRPDLVLRFGDMVTSKATREWLASNPRCRQVVIDPEGAWNDPTWAADEIVRADPQRLCHALLEALPARDDEAWLRLWLDRAGSRRAGHRRSARRARRRAVRAPDLPRAGAGCFPPARSSTSPPACRCATSRPSSPRSPTPLRFLANRGANGIDGVVSSGFGAAAAHGERTFVLLGDVALYHDMNGLLAAKRLDLEATLVVMDNGGGGIFDFLPIAEHRDGYEELFATPTGLDLEQVARPLRTAVQARRELRRHPAGDGRAGAGAGAARSRAQRRAAPRAVRERGRGRRHAAAGRCEPAD